MGFHDDSWLVPVGTSHEGIGAIRFGNRSILSGQVTLGGDARLSNGNAPAYPAINPDNTTLYYDPGNLISGKITGGFALDFGSANSVTTNLMISNTANDWTGNTTFISGGLSSLSSMPSIFVMRWISAM